MKQMFPEVTDARTTSITSGSLILTQAKKTYIVHKIQSLRWINIPLYSVLFWK